MAHILIRSIPLRHLPVFVILLVCVFPAHAQYSTRVVARSGDEAPGADGATFEFFRIEGLSQGERILFYAGLEGGTPNGYKYWMEDDGELQPVPVREGDAVPGLPGVFYDYFEGDRYYNREYLVNLSADGRLAVESAFSGPGVVSGDATTIGNNSGLLIEEVGGLRVAARQGTTIREDFVLSEHATSDLFLGRFPRGGVSDFRTAASFNGSRVAFSAPLHYVAGGQAGGGQEFSGVFVADPSGLTEIALSTTLKNAPPMPGIPGFLLTGIGWRDVFINRAGHVLFWAWGREVDQTDDVILSDRVALYRWSEEEGHEVLLDVPRFDDPGQVTQKVITEITRTTINADGQAGLYGLLPGETERAVYVIAGPGATPRKVVQQGDPAPGAGGASFARLEGPGGLNDSRTAGFVLLDDGRIALFAVLSDGRSGIWLETETGLQPVVIEGEPVPGAGEGVTFRGVSNMVANNSGEVAFAAYQDGSGPQPWIENQGVWVGRLDASGEPELAPVLRAGDQIEIAPGVVRTLTGISVPNAPYGCGMDPIQASGVDGTGEDGLPTYFNDQGSLLMEACFEQSAVEPLSVLVVVSKALVVNTTGDEPDADLSDGLCDIGGEEINDRPPCTLRAAIEQANARDGRDDIRIEIPTDDAGYDDVMDVFTIQPQAALPAVEEPVTIKGTPRPAIASKREEASRTSFVCPEYVLDGKKVDDGFGLVLRGDNSRIEHVAFINSAQAAVHIQSSGNRLYGNCIGSKDGTSTEGTQGVGIFIEGGSNNVIGGPTDAEPNLISGNTSSGIVIDGGDVGANQIYGNRIGTDVTGTRPLPNGGNGISVFGAPNNFIGHAHEDAGPGTGMGNVISSNEGAGILITGSGATNNRIYGNLMGDPDGEALANQEGGVVLQDGSNGNWIGDTNRRFGNAIYDGVLTTGASTTENRVHGNDLAVPTGQMSSEDLHIPLDRDDDGPSCFPWDAGPAGNPELAPPRILELSTERVSGMTKPAAEVEVFEVVDTGTRHGRYFARRVRYLARGSADENGHFSVPVEVADGTSVVVTAIDQEGNTSELSQVKRPIIAVPGIGGSWLETQEFFDDYLWIPGGPVPPPVFLRSSEVNDRLARMAMNPSGTTKEDIEENGVIQSVLGTNVYGQWLAALESAGYAGDSDTWLTADGTPAPESPLDVDLWRFPNDFRLNQLDLATQLKDRIDWLKRSGPEVTRTCQVDLVSHSNGGVITSTYIRAFPESRDDVHRVLEMAVPYLGALKGTQAHTKGYIFDLEESVRILNPRFHPEWGRMVEMARNLPATYALSPSRFYWRASKQFFGAAEASTYHLLQNLSGVPLRSYDEVFKFLTAPKHRLGLDRNAVLWETIEADVSGRIGDWSDWEGPPHIYRIAGTAETSFISGIGLSTPRGWFLGGRSVTYSALRHGAGLRSESGDSPLHSIYRSSLVPIPGHGDGTVPLASASLGRHPQAGQTDLSGVGPDNPWIEDFEYFPCEHVEIVAESCSDRSGRKVLDRMVQIFERGHVARPPTSAAPGKAPYSGQIAPAWQELLFIASSSPVGVHVEDRQGRHTGPARRDSLRDYEYEVSGLGYWVNDLATTLALPGEDVLKITIQVPLSEGTVGVTRVKAGNNGEMRHVFYSDQHLDAGGQVQFDLQNGASPDSTPLQIDADGDGNFEAMIQPAAAATSVSITPARPTPRPFRVEAVAFGTDEEDRQATVMLPDVGGPVWEWNAHSGSNWIELSRTSGQTPDTLGLTFASTSLPTGTHIDTVTVSLRYDGYEAEYPVDVTLRVLESRALTTIEVSPEAVVLEPGGEQQFEAIGFDQAGDSTAFATVWTATGGTINSSGLFTAGTEGGVITVTASDPAGTVQGQATVEIGVSTNAEDEAAANVPTEFSLYQNYPNPFQAQTTIPFDVPESVHIRLSMYDLLGRRVETLADRSYNPGTYDVLLDARSLPAGVYFYTIEMGGFRAVKKMVRVR